MKQIRKMPSCLRIAKYWQPLLEKQKPWFAAWGEENVCMACQCPSIKIQRAHIKAKTDGGVDALENLHNLCETCHQTSEYLDGEKYWIWFNNRSAIDTVASLMMKSGMTFAEVNKRLEEMQHELLSSPQITE